MPKVEENKSKKRRLSGLVMARGRCWTGTLKRALEITGFLVDQGSRDLTFCELKKDLNFVCIFCPDEIYLFRDLGSTNHCPLCHGSLCSGCCRLLQQWWLNPLCLYIVINLTVLCNYCKNQIVVRNLNDGLWVKAIYWDCTSVYFNHQWSSVLLQYDIC